MWPNFWKASLISLAAYAIAILIAVALGLWIVLFLPALQLAWTVFCIVRIVQLRRSGVPDTDGPASDREAYGFYLGGLLSSCTLLFGLVVASQLITNTPR